MRFVLDAFRSRCSKRCHVSPFQPIGGFVLCCTDSLPNRFKLAPLPLPTGTAATAETSQTAHSKKTTYISSACEVALVQPLSKTKTNSPRKRFLLIARSPSNDLQISIWVHTRLVEQHLPRHPRPPGLPGLPRLSGFPAFPDFQNFGNPPRFCKIEF